jgi:hypothetical protein
MRQLAEEFAKDPRYKIPVGARPPALQRDTLDEKTREGYDAYRYVWEYAYYRTLSNFPTHYNRALVEGRENTQRARKTFFEAESLRIFKAANSRSLEKYSLPEGLREWQQVLLSDREFRDSDLIQDQTFEFYWKFLMLYRDEYGPELERQAALLVLANCRPCTQEGACPVGLFDFYAVMKQRAPLDPRLRDQGLGDQGLGTLYVLTDKDGQLLVSDQTAYMFLQRKNLLPPAARPPTAGGPPSGPPGPSGPGAPRERPRP